MYQELTQIELPICPECGQIMTVKHPHAERETSHADDDEWTANAYCDACGCDVYCPSEAWDALHWEVQEVPVSD